MSNASEALFNLRLLAGGAAACLEGAVCFEVPCPQCGRKKETEDGLPGLPLLAAYFIWLLLSNMLRFEHVLANVYNPFFFATNYLSRVKSHASQ